MKIQFEINWEKMQGLVPVVVQDSQTGQVLILAYMNEAALKQTLETGWVTFYSRSKEALWMKGETSGHRLALVDIVTDCDQDSLLVLVKPQGPSCHQGTITCFGDRFDEFNYGFINTLENVIQDRQENPQPGSYTSTLFSQGLERMAQKVGEEGVELALAAVSQSDEKVSQEFADLFFHALVLLKARGLSFSHVIDVLKARH